MVHRCPKAKKMEVTQKLTGAKVAKWICKMSCRCRGTAQLIDCPTCEGAGLRRGVPCETCGATGKTARPV